MAAERPADARQGTVGGAPAAVDGNGRASRRPVALQERGPTAGVLVLVRPAAATTASGLARAEVARAGTTAAAGGDAVSADS